MLDQITGTGDKGEWRVLTTGHSLGGALATLCAYELSQRQ
jgi:thioesterase domain-containing protein